MIGVLWTQAGGPYRNRSLLDLAHEVHDCQNCGRHQPEGCEPAHANWSWAGKGERLKAHDCFHAALCHACHAWLDQGKGPDPTGIYEGDREGKLEMWVHAYIGTMLYYFSRGWIMRVGP